MQAPTYPRNLDPPICVLKIDFLCDAFYGACKFKNIPPKTLFFKVSGFLKYSQNNGFLLTVFGGDKNIREPTNPLIS